MAAAAPLEAGHGARAPRERVVAIAAILGGLVVAAALSPFGHGPRKFLWNFSFYWGPQGVVLAVLAVFRPRPAVVAGAAVAMALHFAAFDAWMGTLPAGEALAWLYYLFSFPGALAGAASAALVVRRRPAWSAPRAGALVGALTLAGIAVNHWATVATRGFGI